MALRTVVAAVVAVCQAPPATVWINRGKHIKDAGKHGTVMKLTMWAGITLLQLPHFQMPTATRFTLS
jgi:hypothetical protein